MSMTLFLVTAAFHLLIPIATGALLAWRPARSRTSRALGLIALLAYTGFLFVAGAGWGMLGQALRFAVVLLVLALCAVAAARAKSAPAFPRGVWPWVLTIAAALAAVLTLSPYPSLATARTHGPGVVDLQSPLEQGRYLVVHGGGNAAVNHHALVRAQHDALDIVAVDAWGYRASGAMPRDLSRYHIFGKRVLAPCDGVVLAAKHDLPDMPPLEADRSAPAGNHVLLHCSEKNVTLVVAHLERGSVAVATGSHVTTGQVLGRVGNSGNTSEPHLHLHGVRGRVSDLEVAIRSAEPVGLRFGGRTWVRNDIVESEAAAR